MSQENVDVVRRIWDLYERGIAEGRPELLAATFEEGLVSPDSTFTPTVDVPGADKTYVGLNGFLTFLRGWVAEFADWRVEVEDLIDAGDDRVVAVIRQSGWGKASGVPVETRFGSVYGLAHGHVVDRRDYPDPKQALEAVGLSE